VCSHVDVRKGDSGDSTRYATTYTGTPSAWVTIKNVETALAGKDQGGAENAWGSVNLCVILASVGLGVAMVLL
jgi:hypothetical protein